MENPVSRRKPKDRTAAARQRRARAKGLHVSVTLTNLEAIEALRRCREVATLRESIESALVGFVRGSDLGIRAQMMRQ